MQFNICSKIDSWTKWATNNTYSKNKNRYSKNNLRLSLECIWYFPFQEIYLPDLTSGLPIFDNELSLVVQRHSALILGFWAFPIPSLFPYTQQALKWMLICALNLDCILSENKNKILKQIIQSSSCLFQFYFKYQTKVGVWRTGGLYI